MTQESTEKKWNVQASTVAMRTTNPIRMIVDRLDMNSINRSKELISLSIGDPTVFGNMDTDDVVTQAVSKITNAKRSNGYAHSCGFPHARKALAEKYSLPNHQLDENDVVIASGASGALDVVIGAIANEHDNILIPTPGFSLYETLCGNRGIEGRFYNLNSEKDWEVDIPHLRSLINEKTRAIIVNNPSNPCGSVYSKKHLQEIIEVAEEFCLPIIADEIYATMVFEGVEFTWMAEVTNTVPIISIGGLAKRFLVPGWRLGWIILYDSQKYLSKFRDGLMRLTTVILGANTLVQGALPEILKKTPQEFYDRINKQLSEHAEHTVKRIEKVPGLSLQAPRGAMYCMVSIDVKLFNEKTNGAIYDDLTFAQALLREESVVVLPGQCFRSPNYFRIVFCPSIEKLEEAYHRISEFCTRKLSIQQE